MNIINVLSFDEFMTIFGHGLLLQAQLMCLNDNDAKEFYLAEYDSYLAPYIANAEEVCYE